ncbi:hypothetical protein EHS25_004571 [Saitozyma podzolica]|uniref:Uncharacterized protein n=1 Tax=Saitozyma podzolica TaxID=1890683 RepID=A0A427YUT6_9TREE|nr:hypothetical protein EHS25_004571 [Saitozyma podzolica]
MGVNQAFGWAAYKFTSTILDDIWPSTLFLTGVATMVTVVTKFTSTSLGINSIMLSVLGTVVSLVVSFKTNNSYARWWDGRNIWSNITSNSRQLATLIWLHIPDTAPPKGCQKAKEHGHDKDSDNGDVEEYEQLRGMIEKKTYIGLVEAFSVAMKHALRGETGPFYTDLYSLIAFLPKYNPSARPPITRDQLLVLWQNGIPRQKPTSSDDSIAVPLTEPASFTGYAFASAPGTETPVAPDPDSDTEPHVGMNPTSGSFFRQAMKAVRPYLFRTEQLGNGSGCEGGDGGVDDGEGGTVCVTDEKGQRHCFAKLDKKHRVIRQSEDTRNGRVPIVTVELMPPRHPPAVMKDWFVSQQRKAFDVREKGGKRKRAGGVRNEIPQEILMYLYAWLADLTRRDQLPAPFLGPMTSALMNLQQALSDLDKIATTPIPSAYSFHLRFSVWIYLFFLPFQLYTSLGWLSIPATALASATYLGFLEIGAQIEMPFAYDQSDLDLDKYVMKIAHQLAEVTAFPTTVPSRQIIMHPLNQPLLPSSTRSALDILSGSPPHTKPTLRGFAASYPSGPSSSPTGVDPKRSDTPKPYKLTELPSEDEAKHTGSDGTTPSPQHARGMTSGTDRTVSGSTFSSAFHRKPSRPAMSVRDLEIALNANWRQVRDETESHLGKPRDQLENRTGVEVAVATL